MATAEQITVTCYAPKGGKDVSIIRIATPVSDAFIHLNKDGSIQQLGAPRENLESDQRLEKVK